jgi:hypothetical protein
MMKTLRQLKWHQILFILAMTFGGLVRLAPVILSGFPINDGGMFYSMIQDLIENHLRLPLYTSYNLSNIPYTYPPLGFYLVAGLHKVTGLSVMTLLQWFPVFVNILSIPIFFLLAASLLKRKDLAAVATGFYALLPGSYSWFIMGGGLSRSLGGLFLLFSVYSLYRLFEENSLKYWLFSGLACSLAVLSHPEIALHTAATCATLWLFYGRTGKNSLHAAGVVGLTALFTSPWWITILRGHGIQPVLSALHSGLYGSPILLSWLHDFLALASYIPITTFVRLIGLYGAIRRRYFFILVWIFLPYLVEPRSAPAISLYPFALLAGIGWEEMLVLIQALFKKRKGSAAPFAGLQSHPASMILLVVLFYLFVECAFYSMTIKKTVLTSASRQMFTWLESNTPSSSRFLLLTGNQQAMVDAAQEWFPTLSKRQSASTLQGLEWTLGDGFSARVTQLALLQTCQSVACLEEWESSNDLHFTHLLLAKKVQFEELIEAFRTQHNPISENAEWIVFDW